MRSETDIHLIKEALQERALQQRMISDAVVILSNTEWLRRKVQEKLLALDNAPIAKFKKLSEQIISLLLALQREERYMDEYMAKYGKLIHEKKTLLPSLGAKKPTYLRGVPQNKSGQDICKKA